MGFRRIGVADVVTMSKKGKMRAIHNDTLPEQPVEYDVVTMSKIGKMRAIHNCQIGHIYELIDVVMMSKVRIIKAIHNGVSICGER